MNLPGVNREDFLFCSGLSVRIPTERSDIKKHVILIAKKLPAFKLAAFIIDASCLSSNEAMG